ncbi:MAG: TonB-dependent receptor [Desulfamplus sp.]|nr:TonB-dependent receptor [Desulfamplus sp.]
MICALFILFFYHPFLKIVEASSSKSSVETLANLSLEQLMSIEVSSTTFFDVAPEKAPGSIYLISQDEIKNSYSKSVSDFLEYYAPGVHISNTYSAGSLYSARGIASPSNATTLFMVNGTNMNVSSGTGINTNLNLPFLGDIERIEVLKGPCSIIHGSGSINGFINVIQKSGRDNLGGFINTDFGLTDKLLKLEAGYGSQSLEYGDIFIYAGGVKSEGVSQTGKSTKSGSENSEELNQTTLNDNYFPDINSRFSINWNRDNFSLFGLVQNEEVESTLPWSAPESTIYNNQPANLSNPPSNTTNSYKNKQIAMQTMTLIPQLNLELTETEDLRIGAPIQYFEYDPAYFSSQQEDSELDSELHLKSNFILKSTRFQDHRIALGASLFFKHFNSDSFSIYLPSLISNDANLMVETKADLKWIETALFFEDNYQLTKNLNLFAGIRYDRVNDASFKFTTLEDIKIKSDDGMSELEIPANTQGDDTDAYELNVLIPRVGVTYDIDDNKTIKFVYQEGYHYPDYITVMNSINYFWGEQAFGKPFNEPLVAEEVKSYELSYYQNFIQDKIGFNLTLYSNIFDNTVFVLIDEDLDGFSDTIISDKFISSGFETSLKVTPNSTTTVEVSYSFSQPYNMKDDTEINPHFVDPSGDRWRAFPEHTVKLNMAKSFMHDKLSFSLGCLFNSPTNTTSQNSSMQIQNRDDIFDHNRFIVNFGARFNLTDNCSLMFKAQNIFDNNVPATGYYYNLQNAENISLEHPTYTIGMSWQF